VNIKDLAEKRRWIKGSSKYDVRSSIEQIKSIRKDDCSVMQR